MKIFYFESAHFQEMARGALTERSLDHEELRTRKVKNGNPVLETSWSLTCGKTTQSWGPVGLNMNTRRARCFQGSCGHPGHGGWQRVWSLTSAPHELTGDGQAMAYRAGAELTDMEMIQTTPGNIIAPPRFKGYSSLYRLSTKIDAGKMITVKANDSWRSMILTG